MASYHQVLLFILLSFVVARLADSAPEKALVTHLPGFSGSFPSEHYSGYVTIDEETGKRLFYYLVQSEGNPAKDPLVLWLNGGPGCSSFDGFVYEHGPFNFEKTKEGQPRLHLNPYTWSKVSNVLYVDSPAGVGLSYAKNVSEYTTGDLKTALDSHNFLLKWFELYPEFLSNPFFITGESYAGVYVPMLASEVAKGIDAGVKPVINLKGYMVGNGVTDDVFDGNALVPFAHGMGLISDDLFQEVTRECNGNFYNPLKQSCENKLQEVDREVSGLNIYDILEPCFHADVVAKDDKIRLPSSFYELGATDRPLPVRTRMFGRAWPFRANVRDGIVPTWPQLLNSNDVPCTDDQVASEWLNIDAVREAIHAEPKHVCGDWQLCTDRITFNHDAGSMIKYHRNLTLKGYRALIYSGDHDMCVPFTGSEAWTRSMGYKIIDKWRPWASNGQIAGYVTINEETEKRLFYYLVQSEGNPSKDPLVLWLNGGPGCSSFDGFVYEHGPFNFEKTKQGLPILHLNPYSWSKVSNILYVDSPSGVGFSYAKNISEYKTGDLKTALDSHKFLFKWLELYPEFLSNPFFIAGESYAGVYIPTLAHEIAKGIDLGVKPVINLKGYMIGNAVTDDVFDGNALVPFAHGMGLISDDLFQEVTQECKGNFYNPPTQKCEKKLQEVDTQVAGLNIYDILEPCYHVDVVAENGTIGLPFSFLELGATDRPLPVRTRLFGRAWPLRANVRDGVVPTWPELLNHIDVPSLCKLFQNDEVATIWLNSEVVREAIHAEPKNVSGDWNLCTDRIIYNHDSGSMIKYHKNLTLKGYRALIYSGDHDMCVPFTGSEAWTRSMGYKIVDKWRPWVSNGQIAGYTQGYANNLTFLTIKGAGHTVPEYKPKESLDFYSRFLAGQAL
ncbi:Serine carboxypeptidase 1 [Linum perenne]